MNYSYARHNRFAFASARAVLSDSMGKLCFLALQGVLPSPAAPEDAAITAQTACMK